MKRNYEEIVTDDESEADALNIIMKYRRSESVITDVMRQQLESEGYCIIRNAISYNDALNYRESLLKWINSSDEFIRHHNEANLHFIQKQYANYNATSFKIRTDDNIINIMKSLYNTNEVISDFGSFIYAPITNKCKQWRHWVHVDQKLSLKGLIGYKCQLNLTDNVDNVIEIFAGSHKYHNELIGGDKGFVYIPPDVLNKYESEVKVIRKQIKMKSGDLLIWDSRLWHHGLHNNPREIRLVQNLSYQPKSKQTLKNKQKAIKILNDRRQTNHWAHNLLLNPDKPRWSKVNKDKIPIEPIEDSVYQKFLNNLI